MPKLVFLPQAGFSGFLEAVSKLGTASKDAEKAATSVEKVTGTLSEATARAGETITKYIYKYDESLASAAGLEDVAKTSALLDDTSSLSKVTDLSSSLDATKLSVSTLESGAGSSEILKALKSDIGSLTTDLLECV